MKNADRFFPLRLTANPLFPNPPAAYADGSPYLRISAFISGEFLFFAGTQHWHSGKNQACVDRIKDAFRETPWALGEIRRAVVPLWLFFTTEGRLLADFVVLLPTSFEATLGNEATLGD